ncbi:MAG: transglycosylase SLT domain-containing protein [Burkholderiaceae bacterium]
MTPRRPALIVLSCAAFVLGGCATTGYDSSDSSTSTATSSTAGGVASSSDVSGKSDAAETRPVASAEAPHSNPAPARYAFPGSTGSPGPIGSVVVTNPLAPRTVDLTLRPDDIWDRIRTGFGIPNLDSPLVAEQQAWYLAHPDYLRRAVDRSSLYLYHVVKELNERGMPTELALLPFVESAYNPMAYSRAHASGMWQFIPGTGKDYNLKQDWWRDQRRDVVASTDAALTYLKRIYEMHGDWHLALASYNWGEGSVKRAIEKNQAAGLPTDYLSLSMPDETRNYVPKLQALKNIIANPEAFGVTLPKIDNEPYFVAVERNRDIDLRTAARLANMSIEDFKALNPSFNRPVILGSSNTPLLVPADRAREFRNSLESHMPLATWQAHTVSRKESIEKIAARYGMTSAALREVNGLGPKARVRPGQALLVQKKGASDVNLRFASFTPPTDAGAFENVSDTSSIYQVRRGDTLFSIARHFGVSADQLRSVNRLKGTQVAMGQHLHVPAVAKSSSTGKATASKAAVTSHASSRTRQRTAASVLRTSTATTTKKRAPH